MRAEFYVYELVSSLDGLVFYVGKGSGNRIEQHEYEANSGAKTKKCNKIRSIWSNGGQVIKREVARFWDESDAYEFEAQRIAEYGIGSLTNVVPGGRGAPALTFHERERRKMRRAFLGRDTAKVLAWLIKVTNFGRTRPVFKGSGDESKWACAFMNAAVLAAPDLLAETLEYVTPQELSAAVAKHGVELVIENA